MTPAEALSKARDVLAERGWHQGDYEGAEGSVCLYGALAAAVGVAPADLGTSTTVVAAAAILPRTRAMDGGLVSIWNDAPERTYEDVVLALKQAEELALDGAA